MSRFYIHKDKIRAGKIHIDGDEAHHILDVMRMKKGDAVVVFDSLGKEYSGLIAETGNKALVVDILRTRDAGPAAGRVNIALVQAIPKKDKMDFIVQKATELGALMITALETDRTVVHLKDKAELKVERWTRIAQEAAKQCGRPDVPVIKKAKDLNGALDLIKDYDIALIAALTDEARPVKEFLSAKTFKSAILFIGPEGDFTPREVALAKERGAFVVSLGGLVLKSDTAALYGLSILNYEMRDC